MRTIEIVIGPAGEIKIEAVGFKGPDCEKATAFLEKALGITTSRGKKAEYYQAKIIKNTQKAGT
jgi:hypothetical protein